jgi:hypothetical protein
MPPRVARDLVKRVAALGDPQTRVALVKSLLPAIDPIELRATIDWLVRRAGLRDTPAQVTLMALTIATSGDHAPATAPLPPREDGTSPPADWGTGRPLTLGERKSLARRPDRRLLERALRDAHPDVISELLLNPRLTEIDVARMCASSVARPEVLTRVFTSPRWSSRARVRSAIAGNPRTPVEVALALVPTLARVDLRAIAADERIGARVRSRALDVLRRLPPTPVGSDERH